MLKSFLKCLKLNKIESVFEAQKHRIVMMLYSLPYKQSSIFFATLLYYIYLSDMVSEIFYMCINTLFIIYTNTRKNEMGDEFSFQKQ